MVLHVIACQHNSSAAPAGCMQALLLSMMNPSPGETFNLVDDDCTGRSAAMSYAAKLLAVQQGDGDGSYGDVGDGDARASAAPAAAPPSAAPVTEAPRVGGSRTDTPAQAEAAVAGAAGASGGGGSVRGRGEKRVSNSKVKRVLGWELAYPSYREGLAAIAAQECHH